MGYIEFLGKVNRFMFFNVCLGLLIILLTFLLRFIISDFSDYPVIKLNMEVNNKLSGLLDIFINNAFIVPFISLMFALIPIPFLYLIPTIMTVFSLSLAIGIQTAYDTIEGFAVFVGVLPHGLLEIYIMSIEVSILYVINKFIIRTIMNLFRKKKKTVTNFIKVVKHSLKYYLVLVIPLSMISALIEVYITPNWFQFIKDMFI